jgi:hypothetical protein
MFVYMLVMSREAILRFSLYGMSLRSLMRWDEFFTLYVYGKGIYVLRLLDSILAILYAGAFFQLITGLMG